MAKREGGEEYPGNTIMAQAAFDRWLYGIGKSVTMLDTALPKWGDDGEYIKAVRFRLPSLPGGEWLAVVTSETADGPKVAFVSAEGFAAVVTRLANLVRNGKLAWKEDQYAGES